MATNPIKAVEVARDVIKHLDTLHVTSGTYFKLNLPTSCPVGESLQKHIDKARSCKVCAIGAAFLSYVRLFNKVKIEDLEVSTEWSDTNMNHVESGPEFMIAKMKNIFGKGNLALMEAAFESDIVQADILQGADDEGHRRGTIPWPEVEKAIAFGERYNDARERLRKIMQNVIRNNGTFKPPRIKRAAASQK